MYTFFRNLYIKTKNVVYRYSNFEKEIKSHLKKATKSKKVTLFRLGINV